eukprot:4869966-Prymnesium_polylepis.1
MADDRVATVCKRLTALLHWEPSVAAGEVETMAEIAQVISSIGSRAVLSAGMLFAEHDRDRNGVLTRNEIEGLNIPEMNLRPGERALTFVQFLRRFKEAQNKSALTEEAQEEVIRHEAAHLMEQYSTDGTAQIRIAAFRRLVTGMDRQHGWSHSVAETLALFERAAVGESLNLDGLCHVLRKMHGFRDPQRSREPTA